MSTTHYAFGLDDAGTLERVSAELGAMPKRIDLARKRALRKLMTWLKRQVLREASRAAGVSQKTMRAALRYRATRNEAGINIWIGTNPLKAHYLGAVRWTRRMKGARAGRRLFPGSWHWGPGSKTGKAVMQRVGADRLPIEPAEVEIHEAISQRLAGMQDEIAERFERLMLQELNYALNVEGR